MAHLKQAPLRIKEMLTDDKNKNRVIMYLAKMKKMYPMKKRLEVQVYADDEEKNEMA